MMPPDIVTDSVPVTATCSQWERRQSGVFQAANVLLLIAFLVPRWSHMRWSVLLRRILTGLACLAFVFWSLAEPCAPDVIGWNALLACTASAQIAYSTWQLFPPSSGSGQPLLVEHLYRKLFLPLRVPRPVFAQLTRGAALNYLPAGAQYCSVEARPQRTLSILLSGKLKVTFGSRLLHVIHPFDFIDSAEWFMDYNCPADLCKTRPAHQISTTAVEPCVLLLLNAAHLQRILVDNGDLGFLFDCLIGKDVSHKLYAVTEESLSTAALRGHCQQGHLAVLEDNGWTSSTLGPWEEQLLRSQSLDAVHCDKEGHVRSYHWRRNQSQRNWCQRYEMLIPSRRKEQDLLRAQHQRHRVREIETFV